jgi:hypothetical protein
LWECVNASFFQNLSERKDRITDTFRAGTQNLAGLNAFQVLADDTHISHSFFFPVYHKKTGTGKKERSHPKVTPIV